MRELSSLIGLQVIATGEGKRLGTVSDVLVDLAAGRLVAVTLAKTPEPSVVLADDIDVVGPDALMISSSDMVKSREEAGEALAEGRRVLGEPPAVITSRGAQLGELGPVQIDEGSGRILRFSISAGPLKDVTEGALTLPVVEGIVHGEDTIIVPHEVVARRLQQAGGLRGALRSLAARLRTRYDHVAERSEKIIHEGGERLKAQAEEAREAAAEKAEVARKKAGEVAREMREKADKVAEEAREALHHEDEEEAGEEAPAGGDDEPTDVVPAAATPLPEHLPEEEAEEEPAEEEPAEEEPAEEEPAEEEPAEEEPAEEGPAEEGPAEEGPAEEGPAEEEPAEEEPAEDEEAEDES